MNDEERAASLDRLKALAKEEANERTAGETLRFSVAVQHAITEALILGLDLAGFRQAIDVVWGDLEAKYKTMCAGKVPGAPE
jgi:hypothetical protein